MHTTLVVSVAISVLVLSSASAQKPPAMQEWPAYAGDAGASHYSPLADLSRENVAHLQIAWEWKPAEDVMPAFGTRPGNFQNTPLMIDDVLYVSTMYNRVVALDAETGKELWSFDPKSYEDGQPPAGRGSCTAVWPRGAPAGSAFFSPAAIV